MIATKPFTQYQISQGQIYYELAYCYVKKGDYPKALACVEVAFSYAGNMTEIWLLKSKRTVLLYWDGDCGNYGYYF